MELDKFIIDVLMKNNIDLEKGKDMENKIMSKAKEYLKNKSGAVEDKLVEKWILDIANDVKEEQKPEQQTLKNRVETLPQRLNDVRNKNWEMDSLF